jgi:hypothetical protein
MFLCPRDDAVGAPLAWFIPERCRAARAGHVRRFGNRAEWGLRRARSVAYDVAAGCCMVQGKTVCRR